MYALKMEVYATNAAIYSTVYSSHNIYPTWSEIAAKQVHGEQMREGWGGIVGQSQRM